MIKNNPAEISKYYERDLLRKIFPYFKTREIIAVVGSRQVGKTTLLRMIWEKISLKRKSLFLTFEKRADLEIFENDIENFKKLYVLPYEAVFLDEFQYAKEAGQKLKYLFDTTKTKFFVSGSSSLEVREAGKYLAGRVFTFYLSPFSFQEFLEIKDKKLYEVAKNGFKQAGSLLSGEEIPCVNPLKSKTLQGKLKDYFEEYLVFGGYPRVVTADKAEEKKIILDSIIDSYLLREIKSLLHLASENELLLLARFLSLQIGNLVSFGELGSATGLTYKEVKKHLQILQKTFILQLVYPFFRNKRTELVKNPKAYFTDTGFRNKIIDNFSLVSVRTDTGALVENFIFNALKGKDIVPPAINFWRTKSQAEVDFILEREGQLVPIEVKYAPLSKKVAGKSLFSFINKYSVKNAIVTTSDEFGMRQVGQTKIYFVPVYYLG